MARSSCSSPVQCTGVVIIWLAATLNSAPGWGSQGYYRGPSLANNTLVFSADGDLWSTSLKATSPGQSRRLTTHPNIESQAQISPDGRWVAFVANYSGTPEIYLMPLKGGVPRRLTFEHSRINLQQWVDNDALLYSTTARPGPPSNWTLKRIDVATRQTEVMPVADALAGSLHIKGRKRTLFFVQFGIQMATDNTNFYRGGMRGRLWRFALGSNDEAVSLLSDHEGNIRDPMIYGDRLYFVSDQDGRDNLWSSDFEGKALRQHTRNSNWSVREVSMGSGSDEGKLVFRRGADIYTLDLRTDDARPEKLSLQIASDHPELRPRWIKDPLKYLSNLTYASALDKVLLTARGKMAMEGLDQSRLVTINTPTSSRSRAGNLSPDGRWVYALNDRSREVEVWRFAADGAAQAEQLTRDNVGFKDNLQLSPNGEWLSYTDGLGDLWLLNTDTKKARRVISGSDYFEPFSNLTWSPNGDLFAVAHTPRKSKRPRILLHALEDGRQQYLSTGKYASRAPRFSPDGQWLYYLSDRNFSPTPSNPWSDRDFGTSFDKRTVVLANALTDEATFAFAHPTELSLAARRDEQDTQSSADDTADEKPQNALVYNWARMSERLYQVPVPANNYSRVELNDKRLYLLLKPAPGASEGIVQTTKVQPTPKLTTFADKASSMSLSTDGEKILLFKRDPKADNHQILIVPAGEKLPKDLTDKVVKTKDWQFSITPREEWQQIFHDAWLMHREMFFDPDLRGVDWDAMKRKYQPLLARATARDELNDVFMQMMAELNALHSQVRGGDLPDDPNATPPGQLGAILRTHTGRPRGVEIVHIYQHDREQPGLAPPLARPGVDARNADVITAVNARAITEVAELYAALQNQVGKQVLLSIRRGKADISTVVVPSDPRLESQHRYQDWVARNRSKVEEADTRLGYMHLQSMVGRDVAGFAIDFTADASKQGMVIDVRRNNGGNVDSWLIGQLLRQAWMFWDPRRSSPYVNMQNAYRGHLIVLADERTYSDGETFTAAIKSFGITDVIGRRTAGAGVWLNNRNRQSDGGLARVAQSPVFDLAGQWVVEGHGVSPTIEVINYPHATFNGADAQLQAAITYLQEKLEREPIKPLVRQPFPRDLMPGADVPARSN